MKWFPTITLILHLKKLSHREWLIPSFKSTESRLFEPRCSTLEVSFICFKEINFKKKLENGRKYWRFLYADQDIQFVWIFFIFNPEPCKETLSVWICSNLELIELTIYRLEEIHLLMKYRERKNKDSTFHIYSHAYTYTH